jgi:hypothetical protein
MSDVPLGKLILSPQNRDAVHVAIAPVEASETLKPGQKVRFVPGKTDLVAAVGEGETSVGIVDPFLRRDVAPNDKFFICLYPGSVTGMRHHWQHSAFPVENTIDISASIDVIRGFADEYGLSYEEILEAAHRFHTTGDYMIEGGRWEGMGLYGEKEERFWTAYEIVTGRKVEEGDRGSIFSCSC